MTKVIGVLAVDKEYGIGNVGKLLPFPREDMLHFQETVKGGIIVCTGSTYKQMRKSLGDFFVYTRRPVYYVTADTACSSGRYLLNKAKVKARKTGQNIYICGGDRLYNLLRDEVDEWLITVDENTYPSDCKLSWVKELMESRLNDTSVYKVLTDTVKVYKVKVK